MKGELDEIDEGQSEGNKMEKVEKEKTEDGGLVGRNKK